jgi:hypothetical protein
MPLKTSDEKQDLILKVFDYFEAESKRGKPFFKSKHFLFPDNFLYRNPSSCIVFHNLYFEISKSQFLAKKA